MPIEALARLARLRAENPSGDAASHRVEAELSGLEAELAARVATLRTALADLRRARERLAGCHGCPRRPTRDNCAGCPVADELLACPVMRVVWDQPTAPPDTSAPEESS